MAFVLVEHVVDDVDLRPAHDVVILAAFAQVYLGTVVLQRLGARLHGIGDHERGRLVGTWMHRVEKVDLPELKKLNQKEIS